VGCKAFTVTRIGSGASLFYLNYVGCKASKIVIDTSHVPGFTLTMWDVKRISLLPTLALIVSFYLNYVGCKVNSFIVYSSKYFSFYLNYVGCKVYQLLSTALQVYCFTLTMWDVKLFLALIYYYSLYAVLP